MGLGSGGEPPLATLATRPLAMVRLQLAACSGAVTIK